MKSALKEVLLTFDVEGPPHKEDFMNSEILTALYNVLKLLGKYDLKGLFFITGSVAKKLACYPKILELLRNHEIGYHSSSHSVKPGIFEYTDIKSYEKAVEASIERETSCIDPFSGVIKGEGGVLSLRKIFPEKEIISFRAPFFCWTPPHLEALRELGFRFDFSTDICNVPVFHKGLAFMPYPIVIDSIFTNSYIIMKKVLSEEFSVFIMHPSHIMFELGGTSYRHYNNPFHPIRVRKRTGTLIKFRFLEFELFISRLHSFQRNMLVKVRDPLDDFRKPLNLKEVNISKVCRENVCKSEKLFGYKPRYLMYHLHRFFEV